MNRQTAKAFAPLIAAFARGEAIQIAGAGPGGWVDLLADDVKWDGIPEDYRIKPEETHRAWTQDEVPIGVQVRRRVETERGCRSLISQVRHDSVTIGGTDESDEYTFSELLELYEYAAPGSPNKVWAPCGLRTGPFFKKARGVKIDDSENDE